MNTAFYEFAPTATPFAFGFAALTRYSFSQNNMRLSAKATRDLSCSTEVLLIVTHCYSSVTQISAIQISDSVLLYS